ncbi:type II toxin-antitoxin system VapB family antitoxin [Aquiflexum sp. TKW24L]|uniref:type II toxin-antitoxin system VapB family antitoxin n=1 Tax=Aquiflexum sp. TKW24L TaxID=2942212 RepID=UPI0032DF437F
METDLINEAMKVSALKTKKATVEAALNLMVSLKNQEKIKLLKGKLKWEGNLESLRQDQ